MRAYHDAEPVAEVMERLSIPIPECGCYAWLGKIGTGGYAYVNYRIGPQKRLTRKAATVALELAGRPRPKGLEVGHTCRMRWCVNPDHMVYQTRSQNSLDRAPYRWVLNCKHCGKPKEQVNWKGVKWACRACNALRSSEWQQEHPTANQDYFTANRVRINAQRRARRAKKE